MTIGGGGGEGDRDLIGLRGAGLRGGTGVEVQMTGAPLDPLDFRALYMRLVNPRISSALENLMC